MELLMVTTAIGVATELFPHQRISLRVCSLLALFCRLLPFWAGFTHATISADKSHAAFLCLASCHLNEYISHAPFGEERKSPFKFDRQNLLETGGDLSAADFSVSACYWAAIADSGYCFPFWFLRPNIFTQPICLSFIFLFASEHWEHKGPRTLCDNHLAMKWKPELKQGGSENTA